MDKPTGMSKVVKKLGENIFGTAVRQAEGAKKIRPGDPNTTSAKTVEAYETQTQRVARLDREAKLKAQAEDLRQESYLSQQRAKMDKRGYITQQEMEVLNYLNRKRQKRT